MRDYYVVLFKTPSGTQFTSSMMLLEDAEKRCEECEKIYPTAVVSVQFVCKQ